MATTERIVVVLSIRLLFMFVLLAIFVSFLYLLYFLQDECSFVSLRDVDRTLQVMMWFYGHKVLFELMDRKAAAELDRETDEEELAPFEVVLFLMLYFYCLLLILFHDEQP